MERREGAESLRGALYVDPDQVRALGDDEYWAHDLSGCLAVDASGTSVGTVRDVIPGAAHDLLEIDTKNGPRLVPMVKEIVTHVDLEGRRVTLDPPAGLLD